MQKTTTLKLANVKIVSFVALFTALAVAMPVITHYFAGANGGRLFLPMHFFIFLAALLLGWRAGLAVGILTPLISFSLTGMPMLAVLPLVIIEVMLYGFLTGYFHKNRNWNVVFSLLGAMLLGRIILLLAVAILPVKMSAIGYVMSATYAGLIGIAIQLILIPLVYLSVKKYISDERA